MPDEDRRAWERVLAHVERQLLDGSLGPGDHLQPERALASELGVGRSSVREAIRVLEVMGLVRSQTGSGPTAGAIIVARPGGGMESLMRLQVAAQGFPVPDVVQTRLLLEDAVALTLAGRLSEADAARATELLDAMDSPTLVPEEFLALDARFHVALAEAAGNQVVAAMMAGLRASIEEYVLRGTDNLPDWPAMSLRLRAEHRTILDMIRRGDAAGARHGLREHISGYYRDALLVPGPPDRSSPHALEPGNPSCPA